MESSNPLANDNLFVKVKNKLTKKSNSNTNTKIPAIEYDIIGMNNSIDICAEACACCWDRPVPDTYSGRADYIAKRTKIGHTSVIEHSNFIIYLSIPVQYTDDFMQLISDSCFKYLNMVFHKSNDDLRWDVMIGGSFRGYANIYKETSCIDSPIIDSISKLLYTYSNSCMFEDICADGLLDKNSFINVDPDGNEPYILSMNNEMYKESNYHNIVWSDNISTILKNVMNINKEFADKLTTRDLLKFGTVSILFKDMSRNATHQLVRHRNAITQESQRYVDYKNAKFVSPTVYKSDRYSDYKYYISFANGASQRLTLQEIGDAICDIYNQLSRDQLSIGVRLLKEDARAFLPGGVQCKKLYMTFTYFNLIKFLYLREDKAAQAEIRKYANTIGDWFRANIPNGEELISTYSTSYRSKLDDEMTIDVPIDDTAVDHIEEDRYIQALGLLDEDDDLDGTDDSPLK